MDLRNGATNYYVLENRDGKFQPDFAENLNLSILRTRIVVLPAKNSVIIYVLYPYYHTILSDRT